MIRPDDDDRALRAPEPPGSLPAPLQAMAEALRANAEALHRLDRSQERIAESIEKSERAQQVVTSTRALNDTFRGLSEIQRGLLDALVKNRGGQGGSPLLVLLAALLSGLLSILVYDRWISERTVPVGRLDEARAEADGLRARIEVMRTEALTAGERERKAGQELEDRDAALAAAGRGAAEAAAKAEKLERELREKETRLEQFLAVKAQADLAGALQIQNAGLEREIRDLKERIAGLERERANALEVFGEKLIDMGQGVDPVALKALADRMGLYQEPAARPPPGVVNLSRSAERLLVQQVNRLLPDAIEESYDLVHVAALADGKRLADVTLTRNRNRMIVNSLSAKEMEIHLDPETDTVELRLKDGEITSPQRPGERVPIPADGHSVFLKGAGVKEWLRREGDRVALESGALVWPHERGSAPKAP